MKLIYISFLASLLISCDQFLNFLEYDFKVTNSYFLIGRIYIIADMDVFGSADLPLCR